jgi:hypothetical protein
MCFQRSLLSACFWSHARGEVQSPRLSAFIPVQPIWLWRSRRRENSAKGKKRKGQSTARAQCLCSSSRGRLYFPKEDATITCTLHAVLQCDCSLAWTAEVHVAWILRACEKKKGKKRQKSFHSTHWNTIIVAWTNSLAATMLWGNPSDVRGHMTCRSWMKSSELIRCHLPSSYPKF